MPYEYGQIILVPVADGRGNVEPHPAVIQELMRLGAARDPE